MTTDIQATGNLMEWGWNPDSVIAGATVLATLAAMCAGWYAALSFRQLRKQADDTAKAAAAAQDQANAANRQLEDERNRRQREQAEKFAVWTDHSGDGSEAEKLFVVMQNSSTMPIYDVRIAACLGSTKNPELFYALQPKEVPPSAGGPARLPAAGATQTHWPAFKKRRPKNPCPRVEVIFRDAAGTTWKRDVEGRLDHYDATEAPMPPTWLNHRKEPVVPRG